MISRKLNIECKYTDLYEELLGKKYKVKSDHKTMLILEELLKNKTSDENETNDEKVMRLLLGETAWAEVKEFLEENENYVENMQVAVIDVLAIVKNTTFEALMSRFQHNTK